MKKGPRLIFLKTRHCHQWLYFQIIGIENNCDFDASFSPSSLILSLRFLRYIFEYHICYIHIVRPSSEVF